MDNSKSVTCSCGNKISTGFQDSYVLDEDLRRLLKSGELFTLSCPDCGRKLKIDTQAAFLFPEDQFRINLIPEKERSAFLLGKFSLGEPCDRIVIGLKELLEKISIRTSNLDDQTIEVLKLGFLTRYKKNLEIYFKEINGEKLVFHVEGLKPGEVGITAIPLSLYHQRLSEKHRWAENQDLAAFLSPPYVNVSQVDVEEEEDPA